MLCVCVCVCSVVSELSSEVGWIFKLLPWPQTLSKIALEYIPNAWNNPESAWYDWSLLHSRGHSNFHCATDSERSPSPSNITAHFRILALWYAHYPGSLTSKPRCSASCRREPNRLWSSLWHLPQWDGGVTSVTRVLSPHHQLDVEKEWFGQWEAETLFQVCSFSSGSASWSC